MSPSPVRILFVDDEERILRSLAMQFRRHYEVLTESDPRRALERLKTERIQVLVSDQRMPQMSGAELLAQARERYPETLRILLTAYSDLDAGPNQTEALAAGKLDVCHALGGTSAILARANGIPAAEEEFTLDTLMNAEEVLITSSGSLGNRVISVDGKPVGGKNPELLKKLQDLAVDEVLVYTKQK